jgi:hypothetical protein
MFSTSTLESECEKKLTSVNILGSLFYLIKTRENFGDGVRGARRAERGGGFSSTSKVKHRLIPLGSQVGLIVPIETLPAKLVQK